MPPQNFPIIQQAGNEAQNGNSSPVKPQCQSPTRNAFSASDMLDMDEIMSSFTTTPTTTTNQTQNDNRRYKEVVSLCLSEQIDSQERLQMLNVLAKNINLSELNSNSNTSDSSSTRNDKCDVQLGSDGSEEMPSTDESMVPNSSSSSSCGSPSAKRMTKSVKDRQRRRPRRYKYNPKPLIEKSGRQAVPRDLKDTEYWERRELNNLAARKTREERRTKELEVLKTIDRLENDNTSLKDYLTKLEEKNRFLVAEFTRRTGEPFVL